MLFELLYLVFLLTNLTFKKIFRIFFVTTISGKTVALTQTPHEIVL